MEGKGRMESWVLGLLLHCGELEAMAQTLAGEFEVRGVVEEVLGSWGRAGEGRDVDGLVVQGLVVHGLALDWERGRLGKSLTNGLGRGLGSGLGRWLELRLGLGDRGGVVVVGFGDPEADAGASFELGAEELAAFRRILPVATPHSVGIGFLEVLDAVLLVTEVPEGAALLVALVLQDLDESCLELRPSCRHQT